MKTTVWLWTIATVLALGFGAWQRMSGPTYPIHGHGMLGGRMFRYTLERTHAGAGDAIVTLVPGASATGTLEWRDHEPVGEWHAVPMTSLSSTRGLAAPIPHHPAPQKVDYRVSLRGPDGTTLELPPAGPATLRFRNDVPAWVLIPHIIVMMGALLLAVRVALECFRPEPNLRLLTLRTLAATFIGGFPLGMTVSGYAFHQPWGGFPLGNDATDTKTLIAFLAWVVAAFVVMRARDPRRARPVVLGASLVMLVVYLVPHSFTMPR